MGGVLAYQNRKIRKMVLDVGSHITCVLQGIILLQGGGPAHMYSTDAEAVFR